MSGGRQHAAKVVVLGESSVGKTSIVALFVFGHTVDTQATIGASFVAKSIKTLSEMEIKFNIWDTAGQVLYIYVYN